MIFYILINSVKNDITLIHKYYLATQKNNNNSNIRLIKLEYKNYIIIWYG